MRLALFSSSSGSSSSSSSSSTSFFSPHVRFSMPFATNLCPQVTFYGSVPESYLSCLEATNWPFSCSTGAFSWYRGDVNKILTPNSQNFQDGRGKCSKMVKRRFHDLAS